MRDPWPNRPLPRTWCRALRRYRTTSSTNDLHWEGSFEQYLQLVKEKPEITRNAFQRLYDMIISYGEEEYLDNKKRLIRYPFFTDPMEGGRDAIHGLDIPLMRLVHVLQAAAQGYGPEKADHPVARTRGFVEEHDGAAPEEGDRELFAHAGRVPLHVPLGESRRHRLRGRGR